MSPKAARLRSSGAFVVRSGFSTSCAGFVYVHSRSVLFARDTHGMRAVLAAKQGNSKRQESGNRGPVPRLQRITEHAEGTTNAPQTVQHA